MCLGSSLCPAALVVLLPDASPTVMTAWTGDDSRGRELHVVPSLRLNKLHDRSVPSCGTQHLPNQQAEAYYDFVVRDVLLIYLLCALCNQQAAVAERLWSERSTTSVDDARVRLHAWRCRLLQRGLATGPVAGGVPTGASGKAPASPTTTFGGHCPSGPWEQAYSPPF